MTSSDPHDLQRFVMAQEGVFVTALAELQSGRKKSHWMWFIFPQLRGLGRSPTALFYGIRSRQEASTYLDHPVLGPRLRLATEAVLAAENESLNALFGSPDDMKFRSSMTLFTMVSPEPRNLFQKALDRWCEGKRDEVTVARLQQD